MKKHLTNDQCVPLIRAREEFENKGNVNGPTLKGHAHTPGSACSLGALPERYHDSVRRATYIVYSYQTPIAWYGPELEITPESVEKFLAGPGVDELEKFLSSDEPPPIYDLPLSEPHWQIPAVRYSRTTTVNHMGALWSALAYEKTWREADDQKSVPSPLWGQTEYARTGALEKRDCSTGGVQW